MRFGFGLVGILVCIGIIAWFWGSVQHPADTVRKGESIKKEVRQWAGQDESGMKTKDSITLEPQLRSGKLQGILVKNLVAGGPMEAHFGLRTGDVIVEAGPMSFRNADDPELAEALVLEAYQRQQPLTVLRNGQEITLAGATADAGTAAAAAAAAGNNAAAAGNGGTRVDPEESKSSLQRQLEAIQKH